MVDTSRQFTRKRWNIFVANKIVAYMSCPTTYEKIVASLEKRLPETHNISIREAEVLDFN